MWDRIESFESATWAAGAFPKHPLPNLFFFWERVMVPHLGGFSLLLVRPWYSPFLSAYIHTLRVFIGLGEGI